MAYQKLPSPPAWIVSQTKQLVEVHSRDAEGCWQALVHAVGESIATEWLGAQAVALSSLYAGNDIAA